jgi:DNA-binding FadR family transcriptional regulator
MGLPRDALPSILRYLVDRERCVKGKKSKLPPIGELAATLDISQGKLREELIAAEAFGIVEMRPGDGTYVRAFDFYSAIRAVTLYGIACDNAQFDRFYEMRSQLELAFLEQAARLLTEDDFARLHRILEEAEHRLKGRPVAIPHDEHREFHLLIFSRLANGFVQGVLKTYWEAYEIVGLHLYFDFSYFEKMWASHRTLVEQLEAQRYDEARATLTTHFDFLSARLQSTD